MQVGVVSPENLLHCLVRRWQSLALSALPLTITPRRERCTTSGPVISNSRGRHRPCWQVYGPARYVPVGGEGIAACVSALRAEVDGGVDRQLRPGQGERTRGE